MSECTRFEALLLEDVGPYKAGEVVVIEDRQVGEDYQLPLLKLPDKTEWVVGVKFKQLDKEQPDVQVDEAPGGDC